jgi:glyoxylase-like metal-dependent hydrolase (beta-lactamase superfamily II)
VTIDGTVQEGDEVAGFQVVDLPGHAPGLIGLWRESDRVAIVTDCFYLTDMYGREVPAQVPEPAYNFDTDQALASIAKLARLDPAVALPGHLGPLSGPDVREQLERAARGLPD